MVDTPSTSKLKLRLLGVRATRNRVAEKPEFARHGLSDFDVMAGSATTEGTRATRGSAFQSDGSNMMAGGARGVVVVVVVV
jgi:hypothetical protein